MACHRKKGANFDEFFQPEAIANLVSVQSEPVLGMKRTMRPAPTRQARQNCNNPRHMRLRQRWHGPRYRTVTSASGGLAERNSTLGSYASKDLNLSKKMIMKRRVLIVDDDLSVRESLRRLLESEGHETRLACNRDEAMECIEGTPLDLVLLDLNLGSDDGWAVYKRIAEIDASVPVVIVTGAHEQEDLAIKAGVDALIEKPIDVASFLEVVNGLLAETREERSYRRQSGEECMHYVPRWGDRYFATMAERYAQPLRLACLSGTKARNRNRKEEKHHEHRVSN